MVRDVNDLLENDIGEPDLVRYILLVSTPVDTPTEEQIRIWLPSWGKHGGWMSIIQLTWIHGDHYSVAPGEDKLEALLAAVFMCRSFIDSHGGNVIYNRDNRGGIPLWLNDVVPTKQKREIESNLTTIEKDILARLKF